MASGRDKPIELESGWAYMEEGISKLKRVLEGESVEAFTAEHYMNLYTTIYNMCTQKPPYDHSEALYGRYKEAFESYITAQVLPSLRDHQGEVLLKQFWHRWTNHKVMVRWLSRFFNYLDRYYIQRHNLHSLNEVGLIVFRDKVYADVNKKARGAMLRCVESEREGDQIDRTLIKNVLSIFQEVGMGEMECYERDFEAELLRSTGEYYRRCAAAWLADDTTPEYLTKAEEAVRAEEERVGAYLHTSTKPKLLKEVETELLAVHQAQLLEKEHSGCAALLRDDKKPDLARMYRLFGRVPKGLDPMAEIFRKHVEAEGLKLVKDATDSSAARKEVAAGGGKPARGDAAGGAGPEATFIRGVLALHDKYQQYVADCFGNSSLFHKALKEAFESACNKTVAGASVAELMASFGDSLLRKGSSERLSDEDLELTLDALVRLLAYVSDKDLFAEFYRKRLARRLLLAGSGSEDHEKGVLARLKAQCGGQFTGKMEGMVNDLSMAKDKERSFAEWRERHARALPLDLSVTVLTTGFWPSYKQLELALPEGMSQGVEAFTAFHDEATKKTRKLSWIFTLGTVVVRASFDKVYEVQVQPIQAAVMAIFNDEPELGYADLRERCRLPEEDLDRVLASLTLGKHRLLLKTPESKSIGRTDVFRVNEGFTDRMRRIKLPLPTTEDRRRVVEDVEKDRRNVIEAAIVRIMKSRKTLAHTGLIMEVVQQLQKLFQPDIKAIKRCIESLIEREFLERDPDNQGTYKYMA